MGEALKILQPRLWATVESLSSPTRRDDRVDILIVGPEEVRQLHPSVDKI